ncbi:MAG: NUDIX domain-containing protein [Firmicutes bacterium]|jgi:8-oxo-dGTP pyrophosphatase MutT (NUDIX family)|nr:NUDIX domain-containing protein [Bacillota bacterium]
MNPHAPAPSRLHIGTTIAIFYQGRVLLDHRRDGKWGLIGGSLELGESLEDCALREALEETGLVVHQLRLLGVFSHPSRIIEYPNGDAVQSITVCFAGTTDSDSVRLSPESQNARFFSREDMESVPVVETHQMIVPYLFCPEAWPVIE